MSAPGVYGAINAVCVELAARGIAKERVNEGEGYRYRSIDDVLDALAPLLAKHRLCIFPRVQKRTVVERAGPGEGLLLHVALRVAFTIMFVDDGTSHVVECYGEALDGGDKATAKAMSIAYKLAMIHAFCIPIAGADDPDRTTIRLKQPVHVPEPVQGWDQWAADVSEMVSLCESDEAIRSIEKRQCALLRSMSRERPDLYSDLGQAVSHRRQELSGQPKRAVPAAGRKREAKRKPLGPAKRLQTANT